MNSFKNTEIRVENNLDDLLNEIKEIEIKLAKCEPNSIMGVHWSSKLAGLKRKMREQVYHIPTLIREVK